MLPGLCPRVVLWVVPRSYARCCEDAAPDARSDLVRNLLVLLQPQVRAVDRRASRAGEPLLDRTDERGATGGEVPAMINGRYAIQAELHISGTVGHAYRAADTRTATGRQQVAIWLLPQGMIASHTIYGELQRCFQRVRPLIHPDIVRLLDIGRDGDTVYVATELVEGRTLREALDDPAQPRLTVAEADRIVATTGNALAYAHDRGIAHGDVRTENILVTPQRGYRLSGFLWGQLKRRQQFMPDQLDDVRALAALAFELYTATPWPAEPDEPRLRELPAPRRKAIAAVLGIDRTGTPIRDARQFLVAAGLPPASGRRQRPVAGGGSGRGRRYLLSDRSLLWVYTGLAVVLLALAGLSEPVRDYMIDLPAEWLTRMNALRAP